MLGTGRQCGGYIMEPWLTVPVGLCLLLFNRGRSHGIQSRKWYPKSWLMDCPLRVEEMCSLLRLDFLVIDEWFLISATHRHHLGTFKMPTIPHPHTSDQLNYNLWVWDTTSSLSKLPKWCQHTAVFENHWIIRGNFCYRYGNFCWHTVIHGIWFLTNILCLVTTWSIPFAGSWWSLSYFYDHHLL